MSTLTDGEYFSFERVPRGKELKFFAEVAPTLAVEIVGKGQGWKKMTEKAAESNAWPSVSGGADMMFPR